MDNATQMEPWQCLKQIAVIVEGPHVYECPILGTTVGITVQRLSYLEHHLQRWNVSYKVLSKSPKMCAVNFGLTQKEMAELLFKCRELA